MNDSLHREMLEEMSLEMHSIPVPSTMVSGGLQRDLANRRVVMLTPDGATGDYIQSVLEAQGVTVQRATPHDRLRTEDHEGQPLLRTGEVVVVTAGDYEAMIATQMHGVLRVVDAIATTLARSRHGSTDDIVLAVTTDEAMASATSTLNILIDRMVEANIASGRAGTDIAARMRGGFGWLDGRDAARFSTPTGRAAEALARIGLDGMELLDHGVRTGRTVVTEGIHDEMALDTFGGRMRLSDEQLDGLFGEDVIAREQERRRCIVLRDEPSMRDIGAVLMKASLPVERFDFGAANQDYNMSRGRKGRGSPGKRGGGRKGR